MSLIEAIVLGIVQGLTEFLPISSSGHLFVVPQLLGWEDPGASFSAVIQLGTMAAVILFFWRDILRIGSAWTRSLWTPSLRGTLDARMGWYVIVGTIPISIAGLAFAEQITTVARDLRLTASMLIIFGILLYVADRLGSQKKTEKDLTLKDGVIFGLAQMMALIPGVSRSGATITAGRALGFNRETAARFSFLLSIPAIVLSGLYEAKDIGADGGVEWGPTIVATIVSFAVGYATIAWLLRWLTSHSVLIFTVYRLFAGLAIFALLGAGVLASS
ncbi:MAG: undecaprenyl-diphosphatase [Actinomycetes bacterium]